MRAAAVILVILVGCATGGGEEPPRIDAPVGTADAATEDGAGAIDATPGTPDAAAPPDAQPPPSAVVSLTPASVIVPRTQQAELTVTIDRPAHAGGAVVTVVSDDPAVAGVPASVTIPAGAISATFLVSGDAAGGPVTVRAQFLASEETASVRVIPAVVSVAPVTSSDIVLGTTVSYAVTLEAPTPVMAALPVSTAAPGIVSVPASVNVPAGATSGNFGVGGVGLGGPATITAGGATATARVVGLWFSEVFYDPASTAMTTSDSMREWVELYNGTTVPIDTTGMQILVANSASGYNDALTLAGTVPAGGCATVGGPLVGADAANYTPDGFVYLFAGDFTPDLGNAGSAASDPGDGLSLATAAGEVIDNVLYGRNNNDMIADELGAASAMDVGDAPSGQSIERTTLTTWAIQVAPTPGDCTPIAP